MNASEAGKLSDRAIKLKQEADVPIYLEKIYGHVKNAAQNGKRSLSVRGYMPTDSNVSKEVIRILRANGYIYDYSPGDSREMMDYGSETISW